MKCFVKSFLLLDLSNGDNMGALVAVPWSPVSVPENPSETSATVIFKGVFKLILQHQMKGKFVRNPVNEVDSEPFRCGGYTWKSQLSLWGDVFHIGIRVIKSANSQLITDVVPIKKRISFTSTKNTSWKRSFETVEVINVAFDPLKSSADNYRWAVSAKLSDLDEMLKEEDREFTVCVDMEDLY